MPEALTKAMDAEAEEPRNREATIIVFLSVIVTTMTLPTA